MTLKKFIDEAFKVGVWIKGVDGILEIIGGFLLFLVKPATIDRVVAALTQHELLNDPNDFLANYLLQLSEDLTRSRELFGAIYLMIHGLAKIIIVYGLLKNKLWGYKAAFVFLITFILYQIYHYNLNHSLGLLFLTVFDILFLGLTWKEYQQRRVVFQS